MSDDVLNVGHLGLTIQSNTTQVNEQLMVDGHSTTTYIDNIYTDTTPLLSFVSSIITDTNQKDFC